MVVMNTYWSLLTTSPGMYKHVPPKTNQLRQQPTSYKTILSSVLVASIKYITTRGASLRTNCFDRLQQLCDISHSRTTPYHPQGNGQVERFNCTLLSMLCTLPESYKSHWHEHLNKVVHAYNCNRNDAAGYSPFYVLFGRHP